MTIREKIKITVRGYKTIHELVPGFLLAMFVQSVLSALLPFINIFMSARIITAIADKKDLRDVLILALVTVLLNLLTNLISSVLSRISDYHSAKFWQVNEEPLNEKIRLMDYELIEDTSVHMMREKIKLLQNTQGLGLSRLVWCFRSVIENFFRVAFSISLVAGAFTTYKTADAGFWNFLFEPWFALVMAGIIIINIALEMFRMSAMIKNTDRIYNDMLQVNRVGFYYMDYILNYKGGKDLKLYALNKIIKIEFGDFFSDFFKDISKDIMKIHIKYGSLGIFMNVILTCIIYIFVAVKALFGSFGVGSIVQYVGALGQLGGGISSFMSNLTIILGAAEGLDIYFKFGRYCKFMIHKKEKTKDACHI